MGGELGGLLLGQVERRAGLLTLLFQYAQSRTGGPQLLAPALPVGVHPVQLTCPAHPLDLAAAGALADLPQQVGGELRQQREPGLQPLAQTAVVPDPLVQLVQAVAQRRVRRAGRPGGTWCPGAHHPYVQDPDAVPPAPRPQRPVHGQRGDRAEPQALDTGRQCDLGGAGHLAAVLQAGHRGDRELDQGSHGQFLRFPPTMALPAGILIS